ncbi:hypothetical protein H5410_002728 [Solanum commersonii]|uniref:Auxin-responsive protein n=1 Tax=Solanum commersonii TaxID=4109 RepID=A0A9J6B326_SOLCO|nr:hypothetical protein H5410_002728 [Solanum commersonii]
MEAAVTTAESGQCFGRKKTTVAITHCKRGKGLTKINGVPIELVQLQILRYKAYEPILLLGRHHFAGYVDEQSKKEIKDILVRYDRTLLVADPRRCEPKKFGGRIARSRKNLASSSSVKYATETQNVVQIRVSTANKKPMEICHKGLFVKINMDGIPIGRKVDLKAYDSYGKLSFTVDQLFRVLLAAQNDPSIGGNEKKENGEKAISGLLDRSGEYTLVYEDNEGDRMLVGDVPWQ